MSARTVKYIFYDACNSRISRPCSEWISRTSTATTAALPVLWWPSQTSVCCSHCWKYDLFWFCSWELEDNFSLVSRLVFMKCNLSERWRFFQERVLVSLWDNGGSVAGQVARRWYFCRRSADTPEARNVCHRYRTQKLSRFLSLPVAFRF